MDILVLVGVGLALALVLEAVLRHRRRKVQKDQDEMWQATQGRIQERLEDPERIASVELVRARLGAQRSYLDMICRSTAASLGAKRAVVTLLDGERQQWVASHFVEEGQEMPDSTGDMPYDQSYCQYVVASDQTFSIEDAQNDHRVDDHPCFTILGVRAYLGTPVHSAEGFPVGSLCVFDTKPRKWSQRDIVSLESFAALVVL